MTASVERYVLDTSALFTLIEDEAGADRVAQLLREAEVHLPCLVLMEVYYVTLQERNQAEADHSYAMLKQLQLTISWEIDEPLLLTAATFKATYQLSFADTLIAAFARRNNAILLHKDPEYEALAGQVMLEALPYKQARKE